MSFKKENIVTIDPWNDNNNLLTEDDVYNIYEKAGIKNRRNMRGLRLCFLGIGMFLGVIVRGKACHEPEHHKHQRKQVIANIDNSPLLYPEVNPSSPLRNLIGASPSE